ncbi:dentin sialophosphoprotein-like [Danaus plexippus]|uniref:dentin sialophosphoprotein-like n=1 Tax=Danaus plexippus TaxID=13037 RepID=UPI002AB0BBED|nr:dentin sialophosphoprotein-like [Danaus plexippus]
MCSTEIKEETVENTISSNSTPKTGINSSSKSREVHSEKISTGSNNINLLSLSHSKSVTPSSEIGSKYVDSNQIIENVISANLQSSSALSNLELSFPHTFSGISATSLSDLSSRNITSLEQNQDVLNNKSLSQNKFEVFRTHSADEKIHDFAYLSKSSLDISHHASHNTSTNDSDNASTNDSDNASTNDSDNASTNDSDSASTNDSDNASVIASNNAFTETLKNN